MSENDVQWIARPIGELLEEIIDYRGKTPPKSPSGIPVLTAANVKDGRVMLNDVSYVSQETYEKWTTRGFPEQGDVLITTEAPVGEVASFPGDRTYLITRRLMALRGKKGELDNDFLKYSLLYSGNRNLLLSAVRGSTVPRVLKTDITGLKILIPPYEEQKSIASFIGNFDDKIELNRRMNETLEAMARAIFKSWFVDFDPVRAKAEGRDTGLPEEIANLFPDSFEETELGEVPRGWEVWRAGDVGDIICGKTPSTKIVEYYGDDVPFITIPDMHGNVFSVNVQKKLSYAGAKSQVKKMLPSGTICVSCIATPGLVVITTEESQTNQQINSVVPHESDQTYYWFWVFRDLGDEIKASGSGGSVLTNLSTGRFSELRVQSSTAELRSAYHLYVGPIFKTILSNIKEMNTLAELRDTLLPRLISGELRVKEAEHLCRRV